MAETAVAATLSRRSALLADSRASSTSDWVVVAESIFSSSLMTVVERLSSWIARLTSYPAYFGPVSTLYQIEKTAMYLETRHQISKAVQRLGEGIFHFARAAIVMEPRGMGKVLNNGCRLVKPSVLLVLVMLFSCRLMVHSLDQVSHVADSNIPGISSYVLRHCERFSSRYDSTSFDLSMD
ncbi:hypothetical protein L202_03143 [Cryptococcus amylolentus CBS 6039]|uniref:Uncharacterized protein n=1 Tax=Cryptococcus amylolentus CBS 6039 TaxID=1295533 RepID=A0A1E3HXR2_9TREE|nr:hypothetical protein L202_03143 [Cryptococcus amylolentus CBS 6039]ODN81047.1 hypothetical protein L202_03143 [Cryptococcus amylolentus CBS 6039]